MKPSVKVIYSPYHRLHIGTGPELPERVEAVWRSLKSERKIVEPPKATEKQLLKVHIKSFIEAVKKIDGKAKSLSEYTALVSNNKKYRHMVDGTCIVHGSFDAACYACGSTMEAMKDDYEAVFALIRPPSHHSHRSFTHGFCLFNNTCVGMENSRSRRVLIVDLDLHFGDGVYSFFRRRKNIKYLSFSFIRMDKQLLKRPSLEDVGNVFVELDPDLLYVILGYDALDFGYMSFTEYLSMFKNILEYASGRKLILELSGGYDVKTLPLYVKKSLEVADEIFG